MGPVILNPLCRKNTKGIPSLPRLSRLAVERAGGPAL
jgi:hypothetical protein